MEGGADKSTQFEGNGGMFDRLLLYFGIFGIFSAVITFYVLLPGTLSSTDQIKQLNPYTYFLLNLTSNNASIYAVLSISAIVVTLAIASIFYGREGSSVGIKASRRIPFFRYLSIFILIELVLSSISPYVSPTFVNDPVLKMPIAAQNFVFISSTLSQTVIIQLLPISILAVAFLGFRRKLNLRNFLNTDTSLKGYEVPILLISATLAAILTSADLGSAVLNFVSFFVLNFIFLKFGFLKALASGFTISEFNIILQFNQIPALPYLMYIFLIIWSLIGVYSFITMITKASEKRQREARDEVESQHQQGDIQTDLSGIDIKEQPRSQISNEMKNPDNFWVRCNCPNCGNVSFELRQDMSLECKNCHHVLDKDAVGEFNIRVIRSRM